MDTLSGSKAGTGRITGVFPDRDSAERVFDAIRDRGYDRGDIDILMTEQTREAYYADVPESERSEMGDRAMEGAGVGSAIGGTIGAIVGAVAAIGTTLILPGVGLIVAGPVAAALAGAGAGGLTGGLLGALVGSGIPEDEAKDYEERLNSGGTAIAVTPKSADDAHFLRDLFDRNSSGHRVYDSHLRHSDSDYSAEHAGDSSHGYARSGSHYSGSYAVRSSSNAGTNESMGNASTASIPGVLGETYQGSTGSSSGGM